MLWGGNMEKQQNVARLIELFKYLWNTTDKEHYTTIVAIQKYLQPLGFKPDRKTLTKDIEILNSIGFFDIEHDRSIQNRYYVTRRVFHEADVGLLEVHVNAARFQFPHRFEQRDGIPSKA